MPDKRISELPVAPTVVDTDLVLGVANGITSRMTVAQIQASVLLDQSFVTVTNEAASLPASRRFVVAASTGLSLTDNGVGSTYSLATVGLLNSLANLSTNGLVVNVGGSVTTRTLVAPASGISIGSADGTGGNPTFGLTDDLAALETLGATGIAVRSAASTWTLRSLVQPAAGLTITNADGVAGAPTFALANDLAALEGLGSTGFAVRSGSDTWVQRALVQPAAGFTITNPAGIAGDATFALANDLAALEGLGSTGFAVRSGSDTWVQRSIAGTANEITLTNGDGVAGNPTVSLPAALTFTGKTVTGGTFTSPTINTPVLTVNDDSFTIRDNLDTTKLVQFQLSAQTTSTTRTLSTPNETGTLALITDATALAIALN